MVICNIETMSFKKGDVYNVLFEINDYYILFRPKSIFTFNIINPLIPLICDKKYFLSESDWVKNVKNKICTL